MLISSGMNAVVTGAGSGIGRAIALALADRGVNVIVSDIRPDAAEAVAEEVRARGCVGLGVATDVSRRDQVAALAETAYGELGDIQILVNNAGVTLIPFRATWDTTDDDYRWIMGVNFWGVVHGHLEFLPRMLETDSPKHIVNTSSMAVTKFTAGAGAYAASKAAVDAASHTLRGELADKGIGVSTLHPGKVRTGILMTEERLRNDEDAATRVVKPWADDYIKSVFTTAAGDTEEGHDLDIPGSADDYMSPDAVGWITVRGIELNLSRILTHPWPTEQLHSTADDFVRGLPDYTAWPAVNHKGMK